MLNVVTALIMATVGLVFLLAGVLMQRVKPVWPNIFYGYRTPRSLSRRELFDAGNAYSARLIVRLGLALIGLALVYFFALPEVERPEGFENALFTLVPVLGCTALLLVATERHLIALKRTLPPPAPGDVLRY